jgi:polyphosphate kinase
VTQIDPHSRPSTVAATDAYLNKELSWLEFNARVLEEALAPETPLLERLKFLSIFTSNLDEFFMVRVAGLKKMEQEALRFTDSPDAMETTVVLDRIRARTVELTGVQYQCLLELVLPELAARDVKIVPMAELSAAQRSALDHYFDTEISTVLTPLGCDPAHPFPFLSNQALYMVVVPKDLVLRGESEVPGIGFVEVPQVIPRLVPVQSDRPGAARFVMLEDLIAHNLGKLFFGLNVEATYMIRVTRNLDYNLLENKVVDLLKTIQKEMANREHQEVVRVEVDRDLPEPLLARLRNFLGVAEADVYRVPWPMHPSGLMALYKLDMEALKDPAFNPRLPRALAGTDDIFSVVAKQDLLVHHPYESFYAVTEFLATAAHDPNVLAIKQTLYRSSGDSPIIEALIAAAENGKQVTAVIELKARFDEKNNIGWARRLERAGVNVVFGFIGLKTHCKMAMVVRRESNQLVRYVHLSTGNYNSTTAKLYTDIGMFTVDEAIGRDVATIFNLVTGFDVLSPSAGPNRLKDQEIAAKLSKLALAPVNMRQTILGLIDREIEFKKRTGEGYIVAKMNALVDKAIIDALYRASSAGVAIKLIVRGICCLRPGVPGVSDNIEVISILDRFLEHSRIFCFGHGGDQKIFLASADWMPRNMDRRIEIMWPIENPAIKARIATEIIRIYWADNVKARVLTADGRYLRRAQRPGDEPVRAQTQLIKLAREGGIQSIPYEIAIRHNPTRTPGKRPIAKRKDKKKAPPSLGGQGVETPQATGSTQVPAAPHASGASAAPPPVAPQPPASAQPQAPEAGGGGDNAAPAPAEAAPKNGNGKS